METDGERGEAGAPGGKWRPVDTAPAVLFCLTVLGICATGLLTLLNAAGRLH